MNSIFRIFLNCYPSLYKFEKIRLKTDYSMNLSYAFADYKSICPPYLQLKAGVLTNLHGHSSPKKREKNVRRIDGVLVIFTRGISSFRVGDMAIH